jgi:hypothetical protein
MIGSVGLGENAMGQRRGYVRLVGLAVGTMLLWPPLGLAEVATDGTLGAKVRRTGPDVTIPAAPSTCQPKIAKSEMRPILRGSRDTADLGPDRKGLPPGSSVVGGGNVLAVEREEVVDLVMR